MSKFTRGGATLPAMEQLFGSVSKSCGHRANRMMKEQF